MLDVTDNIVGGEVVHPAGVRAFDERRSRTSSSRPTRAPPRSRTPPTRSRSSTASGSATRSPPAAPRATTTRRSASPPAAPGRASSATSASSAATSTRARSRSSGIGDMSGDVFGNGMLLSRQIQLVAAFDHRHVFLDPSPDPAASFAERERLFALGAGTSWMDYDRAADLAPAAACGRAPRSRCRSRPRRAPRSASRPSRSTRTSSCGRSCARPSTCSGTAASARSSRPPSETHAEVGDRDNDAIRVDGRELRARVVGEGGNLGLTQRGRIEYATAGGRINTDAIDNSAGVDCSDHEVNIKILLGAAVERGSLTLDGARRAARRRGRRGLRARALRQLPAGADPQPGAGDGAAARRGARDAHARARARGPARIASSRRCPPTRRSWPSASARAAA